MRKKILCGIAVLAMTMSVCMAVVAAEDPIATKDKLNSRGSIEYSQGEDSVIIDSADLYTLAEQLDSFKVRVIEQLGKMGTYLSKAGGDVPLTEAEGVYVGHNSRLDEEDEVDPLSLSFAAILESVAYSQSISTDPETYDRPPALYKTWKGRLTEKASEGVEDVHIHAATADNLSAGAAAWVNGELLLGTGADVEKASGNDEPLVQHDISFGYTMPENMATAFVCVTTTGSGDSDAAGTPSLSVNGGGTCEQIFYRSYYDSGFNLKVALYHLRNIPKGAVITGSGGLLFY